MKKLLPKLTAPLLLFLFLQPLQAFELEDYEVFAGGGIVTPVGAGYVFPSISAVGGIGGYVSNDALDNLFLEVDVTQSVIPAFDSIGAAFFTDVTLLSSLVYQVDDLWKIKPKLGVNVAYSSASQASSPFALSIHYGFTGFYYLEELGFDVYADIENSLNLFRITVFTSRLSGGVQIPIVLDF